METKQMINGSSMLKYILILMICMSFQLSFAQEKRYKVQHFTTEEGLSQNFIETIFQDSFGFLWIGTNDGLNIFDGYKFKIIKALDKRKSSISGNHIFSLKEDKNKNIWIASNHGLNKYTYSNDTYTHYLKSEKNASSISNDDVRDIVIDKDQNIWIGSFGGGLDFLPASEVNSPNPKFQHFRHSKNSTSDLVSDSLQCLTMDNEGNIWIGTVNGLSCFHPKTKQFESFKTSAASNQLSSNMVYTVYKDKANKIWVGTNMGLNLYIPESKTFKRYEAEPNNPQKLHHAVVYSISEDYNGRMLIGGLGGLHFFDPKTDIFERMPAKINDEHSLSNEYINSVLSDNTGIVWVGTEAGGLNKFNPNQKNFYFYSMDTINNKGLNHNILNSIYDFKDALWIGTSGGGINILNKKTKKFTYLKNNPKDPKSISLNFVSCLTPDRKGNVWAGTWGGGINVVDIENPVGAKKRMMPDPKDPFSIESEFVASIDLDNRNIAWAATFGGLCLCDMATGKFYSFSKINGTSIKKAGGVAFTKEGNVWVATENGVFYVETPKSYSSIEDFIKRSKAFHYQNDPKNPKSLQGVHITYLLLDSEGTLWMTTRGNGINRLAKFNTTTHEAEFENLTQANGLSNNMIYGALEDKSSRLWITTDKGLSSYNYKTKIFKNYYTTDGLQSNQFFWGAFHKNANGDIFVGGINGLNYFNPEEIRDNPNVPPAYIVDFKIYNKSILTDSVYWNKISSSLITDKEIKLTYKEAIFSIEFSGLSYDQPLKNLYAYKLDGVDNDWVLIGADRRFASYTNLAPGEYTFQVKASNNDGVWNNAATTVKIIILPPWWQTWWFRALMVIVIGGGTVGFYTLRLNAAKRQNRILEQKVTERTAELQDANTLLEEHQEEITQQAEELKTVNEELESEKEKVVHSFKNYQILSEFGQKITSQLDTESLNAMVYRYVKSLMSADSFGIGLYSAKKQSIDYYTYFEYDKAIKFLSIPLDQKNSLTAWCANNKKAVFINNLEREAYKYIDEKPSIVTGFVPNSQILLPLSYDDTLIGVICIMSNEVHAYTDIDLNIMQTLSSYLSIALNNSHTFELLKLQNQNIKSSIHYAENIQKAILPDKKKIDQYFNSFIIYQPKDVVSGDFYWFNEVDGKLVMAVVDCTGHGVPGAFMSLIGSQLISKIVNEKRILDPAQILKELNNEIIESLRQNDSNNNDGMDLCICTIEKIDGGYDFTFAGAKNSVVVYREKYKTIEKLKHDGHSLGGKSLIGKNYVFNNQNIQLESNDMVYLYTDGIIDLNNADRKRYGTTKLVNLLNSIASLDMQQQELAILESMFEHNSSNDQRDDITIVGLRMI